MAIQIPWDTTESAILLKACIDVEKGLISRKTAVERVSKQLRSMAISKGMQIDEIYRYENGISMQLNAMRNCYLHREGGLTQSKVFHEVVGIYEHDRREFERLLQGSNKEVNTHREEFLQWLDNYHSECAKETANSFSLLSALALKAKIINTPLYKIDNVDVITFLKDHLQKGKSRLVSNKRQQQKCANALDLYLQFLNSNQINNEESNAEEKGLMYVDFNKAQKYAHTKPLACSYCSERIMFRGWNELYISIVKLLYRDHKECFYSGLTLPASERIDVIDDPSKMTYPKEIADGLYLECNTSATSAVNKMRAFLDLCNVNYDDVIITYENRTKDKSSLDKNVVSKAESSVETEEYTQYKRNIKELLLKHYQYGFRLDSPIELMRLQKFAMEDGIQLPDDSILTKAISSVGIEMEGKIYVIDSATANSLNQIIQSVIDDGTNVVFYDSFREINEEWCANNHIFSSEMLRNVMASVLPQFYFAKNFVSFVGKHTEKSATVTEIKRVWSDQNIMSVSDLRLLLPFIPENRITRHLSEGGTFIWVSDGKYYLMDRFIITAEEKKDIEDYVNNACKSDGFASMSDIPIDSIVEHNYEMPMFAIQEAIYKSILANTYHINGKILTEDKGTSVVSILKKSLRDKETATFDETEKEIEQITGATNRQAAFTALYDCMTRIDKIHYCSDKSVHFEIETIDKLLDEYYPDGFGAIKRVTSFAMFPECGYGWNHYVLESYCYKYSKKYHLKVINLNDSNSGMIVRDDIKLGYNELLSRVAADSYITLSEETVGQYFFESGYTAKRSYSMLSEIVESAKTIRGRT